VKAGTSLEKLSKNSKHIFTLIVFQIYCILCISLFFWGCSENRDEITKSPEDSLPSVKEPLKAYHLVEYLTTEVRSAPLLSQKSHPDGWKKANCIQCHQTPTKLDPKVCNDCHGKNGVNDEKDTCSSCHKVQSEYGDPISGNHQAHVTEGPKDTKCLKCHTGGPDQSKSHANGTLDIIIAKDGKYVPLKEENGIVGSCSNISCHNDARKWGGDCRSCHYDPPNTGYHKQHIAQDNVSCQSCHLGNQHDSNVQSGSIELGGIKYNAYTGDCTSNCHGQRKWSCTDCHSYPPSTGNHSDHKIGCDQCHSNHKHSYKSAMSPKDFTDSQVSFASGVGEFDPKSQSCSSIECHPDLRVWGENCSACHGNPPKTGSHVVHIEQGKLDCQNCHEGNKHDLDVNSGSIEVGDIGFDKFSGSCNSTCHSNPVSWGCESCHGYPPKTGHHETHKLFSCDMCHKDHDHSYKAAVSPNDLSDVKVSFTIAGSWDKPNKTCNSIVCHANRQW
jgi:hypothetical protein